MQQQFGKETPFAEVAELALLMKVITPRLDRDEWVTVD